MSYHINNEQKFNDVIFANRNKAYGAYAIRSVYGETVLKSLGIMIFGVSTLFGMAFYLSHKNDVNKLLAPDKVKDSVYVIPVYFQEEEIKKPEETKIIEPATPPVKTISSVLSIRINDSVSVEKSDTALHLNSSTANPTATLSGTTENGVITNSVALGNSTSGNNKVKDPVKGGFEVDSQPEFEGGLPALYRFIASQLKYPDIASREGQEGKVYVRFVVDENGNVGDLTLLNRIGYGMDEEALRVVNLIPKFKTPAKIKGEAVKVYFQLPIRFHYH